jgi:hypothetical protein
MLAVNFCPFCGYNELVVSTFTPKFIKAPTLLLVGCEKCKEESVITSLGTKGKEHHAKAPSS